VKRPSNLFNIDRSSDEIPLNHSIELESSFVIKKQKQCLIKSNKKKNSSKKRSIYLTDIESSGMGSLNERIKNILSNKKKKNDSRSKNKSSSRRHSSQSSDARYGSRKDEKNKTQKSSQENSSKKKKFFAFNSGTLRDCGENFILNDNPGVGMYDHADSPYYGIVFHNY